MAKTQPGTKRGKREDNASRNPSEKPGPAWASGLMVTDESRLGFRPGG
jgi:hypothetical protein